MSRIFVVCAVLALVATQTHGVRIKYMSYAQIVAKLKALEQQYPDLVEVRRSCPPRYSAIMEPRALVARCSSLGRCYGQRGS